MLLPLNAIVACLYQAAPYPVTCLGYVRVSYIFTNRNDVGQILYMSWLILIMPLSMSMLNCAISFRKRRAGELFYNNRSAQC